MLTWQSCLFACCARNYVKKSGLFTLMYKFLPALDPIESKYLKAHFLGGFCLTHPSCHHLSYKFSLLNTAGKYCLRTIFVSFNFSVSSHCSQEIQKSHQTHEREVSDSRKHEKHNSSIAFPPASWKKIQGQKFIFHWEWHKHLTTCIIMNIIILMLCLTLLLIFPSTHSSVW